jgi:hypothetical protein
VKKSRHLDTLRPASFLSKDGFAKAVTEAYCTACSTFKTVRHSKYKTDLLREVVFEGQCSWNDMPLLSGLMNIDS